MKEQPCPKCKKMIRFTPRPDGTSAWLSCCETNVVHEDGKLVSTGNRAYDWARRRGGELRVG
jgi:hypothetical protein